MSWGKGLPELLTPCFTDGKPNGILGPIDPSKNSTFEILKKLAKEWKGVFPDKYIHLGGDEVSFRCWQSNPKITAFMKSIKIKTYGQLENYYLQVWRGWQGVTL
jgi:hexosaminidase